MDSGREGMIAARPGREGPADGRSGATVEVGIDLRRLVAAFGPDILLRVPPVFRGAANRRRVRDLLLGEARHLPGFLAADGTDALRWLAFRVAGGQEQAFIAALRALVHELLLDEAAAPHADPGGAHPGTRGTG
ncbi:hypothetical protein M0638_22855 [Roseomonas sp. NAR14]|uniref:Uncharacterized protein n=1 Tax=Roseomonas acroporae TaxID=2937791 RepID=A0A9X1YEJ9_9PROT|nr:hypothetical protein [Roseomonas acroporae]MCK8787217.1 hypothetical protein [Roseomonas acroporae]